MIRLTYDPFDPGALLSEFCRGRSEVGAVATFTGIARAEEGSTTTLELEAYPGFTEAEIGKIYKGRVRKIMDFGAFVEIFPGTDGLVHISQLANHRVAKVTDVVNEGDEIHVKVLEIDPKSGKIRLSLREAQREMAAAGQN